MLFLALCKWPVRRMWAAQEPRCKAGSRAQDTSCKDCRSCRDGGSKQDSTHRFLAGTEWVLFVMKVEAALVSPLHCTASGVGLYKAETAANARFEVETITMHGRHKSLTNIGQLSVEFFLMTADLRPRLGMDVEKHAQACIVIACIVVAYIVITYVNMAHQLWSVSLWPM